MLSVVSFATLFLDLFCIRLMSSTDKDIQHAAATMIERYGDDALKEVDLRILELQSRNQQDALELWQQIRNRVKLLLQEKPDAGQQ